VEAAIYLQSASTTAAFTETLCQETCQRKCVMLTSSVFHYILFHTDQTINSNIQVSLLVLLLLKFSSVKRTVIILLVVLYGCETWSLTLKEEHRLRLFENRVLRKIFGPRRD
jgi:hypothetical protein